MVWLISGGAVLPGSIIELIDSHLGGRMDNDSLRVEEIAHETCQPRHDTISVPEVTHLGMSQDVFSREGAQQSGPATVLMIAAVDYGRKLFLQLVKQTGVNTGRDVLEVHQQDAS